MIIVFQKVKTDFQQLINDVESMYSVWCDGHLPNSVIFSSLNETSAEARISERLLPKSTLRLLPNLGPTN